MLRRFSLHLWRSPFDAISFVFFLLEDLQAFEWFSMVSYGFPWFSVVFSWLIWILALAGPFATPVTLEWSQQGMLAEKGRSSVGSCCNKCFARLSLTSSARTIRRRTLPHHDRVALGCLWFHTQHNGLTRS